MAHTAPRRTYALGVGEVPVYPGGPASPYGVDYEPGDAQRPMWMWEGACHGQGAAHLTAAEALAPVWRDHLARAGAGWLVPLLERMAAGRPVAWEEVAREYAHVHGAPPRRVA